MIRTVLGDINPSELGYCHSHEHLWIDNDINDFDSSLKELRNYRIAGGRSLLDAQPVNAGGSVEKLKEMSRGSGVNIIACNGFHLYKHYGGREIPVITYIKDTGIMKCALDVPDNLHIYARAMDETLRIAKDYRFPVLVHVEKNADVLSFLEAIDKKGQDLHKVILCHLDRAVDDLSIHEEAFKAGCYLEYDTIGRYKYHDDDRECRIINYGINKGFEKQILLSLDTTRQRLESYGGTPGLGFIRKNFERIMIDKGITEGNIENFMVKNPGRAFNIE